MTNRNPFSPSFAHYLIFPCCITGFPLCPATSSDTLSSSYTVLVIKTGKCDWYSVGEDNKCNQISYNAHDSPLPHRKELPSLKPQLSSPALHFDEAITPFSTLWFYKWLVLLLSPSSRPAFINNEQIGFYFWLPITKWKYVQRYGLFPSLYATPSITAVTRLRAPWKVGAASSCLSLYL